MLEQTQQGRAKIYTDSENGVVPPNKKYAIHDAVILTIIQEYEERTAVEYWEPSSRIHIGIVNILRKHPLSVTSLIAV